MGREDEAERILSHILSLRDGFVVPIISVYGRSGSGKSTVVSMVCSELDDIIEYRFINLRSASTVFGCANLILGALGSQRISATEGLNKAVECLECEAQRILESSSKRILVLVLDEYDVVFSDKRANPSDFVYKLLRIEEKLREKDYWLCILTISNNAIQDYELDDRIKSRMGTAEVSFRPYSKDEVVGILKDRAKKGFSITVGDKILEYCARLSSSDHGDARRALELLRTSGELCDGTKITKEDVDSAYRLIQKDRVEEVVSFGSYHTRVVAASLCSLSLLGEEPWCATSSIYKKYVDMTASDQKALSYRRVSDLLGELEDSGILVSRAYSRGRKGYGREYKLKMSPELVAEYVGKEFADNLIRRKATSDAIKKYQEARKRLGRRRFFDTSMLGNL